MAIIFSLSVKSSSHLYLIFNPAKNSFCIDRVMYFRVMYPYLVMYPYFPKLFNQKWFCYIMSTFAQKRLHSIIYMMYNIWINYCILLNVNGCSKNQKLYYKSKLHISWESYNNNYISHYVLVLLVATLWFLIDKSE